MLTLNGKIYLQSIGSGLLSVEGGVLVPSDLPPLQSKEMLEGECLLGTGTLFASEKRLYLAEEGLIKRFPTGADSYLQTNRISALTRSSVGDIVVGTRRGGAVVLDAVGQHPRIVNRRSGLGSGEQVSAILNDYQGNLWVPGTRAYHASILRQRTLATFKDFIRRFIPLAEWG